MFNDQAARAGYPVRETDAIAAINRGQVYVSRLRAELAKMQG